eukprot:gene17739-biopygen7682
MRRTPSVRAADRLRVVRPRVTRLRRRVGPLAVRRSGRAMLRRAVPRCAPPPRAAPRRAALSCTWPGWAALRRAAPCCYVPPRRAPLRRALRRSAVPSRAAPCSSVPGRTIAGARACACAMQAGACAGLLLSPAASRFIQIQIKETPIK